MGDDLKEMGGQDIDDVVNYRRMLGSGGEEVGTESYVLYICVNMGMGGIGCLMCSVRRRRKLRLDHGLQEDERRPLKSRSGGGRPGACLITL